MHLIKEHIFGLKKVVKAKPHEEQGRVIVHDQVQVRGDVLKSLPLQFGSDYFSALISVPVKNITTFTIAVGALRIPLLSTMTLSPNIELLQQNVEHENTLSLIANDGKYLYIKTTNKEIFDKWHLAIREALAEMTFREAFCRMSDGSVSIRKIEMAIQKCKLLVPAANCHMLRAKKILSIKLELKQLLARLGKNPKGVSSDEVQDFLKRAECDRILMRDSQLLSLKALEPQLFSSDAIDRISAPISHHASPSSLYSSATAAESIAASLKVIQLTSGHSSAVDDLKSPIKNAFQRSLAEVSLSSVKKPVPSSAITSLPPRSLPAVPEEVAYSSVLIDDAAVASDCNLLSGTWWAQTASSPDVTPVKEDEEEYRRMRREKRRRNKVLKYQSTPAPPPVAAEVPEEMPDSPISVQVADDAANEPLQTEKDEQEPESIKSQDMVCCTTEETVVLTGAGSECDFEIDSEDDSKNDSKNDSPDTDTTAQIFIGDSHMTENLEHKEDAPLDHTSPRSSHDVFESAESPRKPLDEDHSVCSNRQDAAALVCVTESPSGIACDLKNTMSATTITCSELTSNSQNTLVTPFHTALGRMGSVSCDAHTVMTAHSHRSRRSACSQRSEDECRLDEVISMISKLVSGVSDSESSSDASDRESNGDCGSIHDDLPEVNRQRRARKSTGEKKAKKTGGKVKSAATDAAAVESNEDSDLESYADILQDMFVSDEEEELQTELEAEESERQRRIHGGEDEATVQSFATTLTTLSAGSTSDRMVPIYMRPHHRSSHATAGPYFGAYGAKKQQLTLQQQLRLQQQKVQRGSPQTPVKLSPHKNLRMSPVLLTQQRRSPSQQTAVLSPLTEQAVAEHNSSPHRSPQRMFVDSANENSPHKYLSPLSPAKKSSQQLSKTSKQKTAVRSPLQSITNSRAFNSLPVLEETSVKAYRALTNSLAKVDTPVKVPDSRHVTSTFSMRRPAVEILTSHSISNHTDIGNNNTSYSEVVHTALFKTPCSSSSGGDNTGRESQCKVSPSDILFQELTNMYVSPATPFTATQTTIDASNNMSLGDMYCSKSPSDEELIAELFSDAVFEVNGGNTESRKESTVSSSTEQCNKTVSGPLRVTDALQQFVQSVTERGARKPMWFLLLVLVCCLLPLLIGRLGAFQIVPVVVSPVTPNVPTASSALNNMSFVMSPVEEFVRNSTIVVQSSSIATLDVKEVNTSKAAVTSLEEARADFNQYLERHSSVMQTSDQTPFRGKLQITIEFRNPVVGAKDSLKRIGHSVKAAGQKLLNMLSIQKNRATKMLI